MAGLGQGGAEWPREEDGQSVRTKEGVLGFPTCSPCSIISSSRPTARSTCQAHNSRPPTTTA